MSRKIFSLIFGNLASKGVGFFREMLFANYFGTGNVAAAFRIAQTAFLMPTHSLVGDSLSAGLLPLYKQLRTEDPDKSRILVVIASVYAIAFSAIVTACLYFLSDHIVKFIAPGGTPEALNVASLLLKVMGLATPFYVMSGMLSYVETAHGQYGSIAWRPMLLNVGSIAGVILAVWSHLDQWLAMGILLSHICFFFWTVTELIRLDRIFPEKSFANKIWTAISKIFLMNMLPLIGLPIIAQTNVLVERVVSSWINTEVIPAVDYARFVNDNAVQLIAVPLGIITMSTHGGLRTKAALEHIRVNASSIIILAFPAAAFICINSQSIVHLLFARGAFDQNSVEITSQILSTMSFGLGASVCSYYLVKALNSQLRNFTSLGLTAAACLLNMACNLMLWRYFGAATIGLSAAANAFLLMILSIYVLNIERQMIPLLICVAASAAFELTMGYFANKYLLYPWNICVNLLIFVATWSICYLIFPSAKEALAPLTKMGRNAIKRILPPKT